jgi:hypothetical protein
MVEDNQKPVTEIELSDSITYIQKPTTELTDTIIIKKNNESRTSIKNNINNQDSQQRMGVISTIFLELYKMVTSSLLVLFVPQSCKRELCTITQNMKWNRKHHLYNTGLVLNFITLAVFSSLYVIEFIRENRLIKYLDVNKSLPTSNDDVGKTLDLIPIDKKNKILFIDKCYQIVGYTSIGIFTINSIISGIIVNKYYLGSQTNTSLITSILFMITKFINVYSVANTAKNIFYSAYLKTNVQFNDLDEQYKIII